MVRQGHLIAAVVGTLLVCCAVLLLVVGFAGSQSQAPPKADHKEDQGHIEATREAHEHTEATASEEEARCEGTRTFPRKTNVFMPFRRTTNDLPGCPNGGLLLGTDKKDRLAGVKGDDKIRGLGARDEISGGDGNDVLYGGAGNDYLYPEKGEDVIYGGDGNDFIDDDYRDGQPDKLYCGKGRDKYNAANSDYVDSSCEKKIKPRPQGGGAGGAA